MINFGAHFESNPHSASLKFPTGLGLTVGEEIKRILDNSYTPLKFPYELRTQEKKVSVENISLRSLAELTLRATTAKDIIWALGSAKAMYEPDIEKALRKVPWDRILPSGAALALRISTAKSRLYHSGLVKEHAEKFFIAEGFLVVNKDSALTTVDISIDNNVLFLGLTLAGEPLNHRGYRASLSHQAPLNETLAATLINLAIDEITNIDPAMPITPTDIHVPFAGTGTLGFEGLLKFGNIAPALFRNSYAVEKFLCISESSVAHTRKKIRQEILATLPKIFFLENSAKSIEELKSNSAFIGEHLRSLDIPPPSITIEQENFFELREPPQSEGPICLLLNPPYGHRLSTADGFFLKLGEQVNRLYSKQEKSVWGMILVPPDQRAKDFLKTAKAKFTKRLTVRNGGLATEAIVFLL